MFSYLPLRTYVLSLLIISSIFSLKGQEEEPKSPKEQPKAPEEQPIKHYKGFKLEFAAPFNRFTLYQGEGLGVGVVYFAPQYYIRSNISMGLQYELDVALLYDYLLPIQTFMVTGDYYFTNKEIRPSLGMGVGLGSAFLVVSPRFKLHLDWFIFHLSYDININIHEEFPNSFRFGIAFTLFGRKKKKKQPKSPKEEQQQQPITPEEEALKRYKGFKLEFAAPFNRIAFYGREGSVFGLILLAPQYYINNNISVGLQYESQGFSNIFMATGDYYFGNGKNRPALGLGVGLNRHETFVVVFGDGGFYKNRNAWVLSPRFKYHLGWFNLNLNYDINIHRQVPHSFQFGIGFTLFGKKK